MPGSQDSARVWMRRFPTGRLANAAFQYWFARSIEIELGCTVLFGEQQRVSAMGDPLPWQLFDLALPADGDVLLQSQSGQNSAVLSLGLRRDISPEKDFDTLRAALRVAAGGVVMVDGYFQYDTHFLRSVSACRKAFEAHLRPNAATGNTFQRLLGENMQVMGLLARERYLIVAHVRRGDYVGHPTSTIFYPSDLEAVYAQVQSLIGVHRVRSPLLYLASDDLPACRAFFAARGVNCLTSDDVLGPGQHQPASALLADMAAMASASALLAANSSLSVLSSLFNDSARVCLRPLADGSFVPFDPWMTPVVFGA